MKQKYVADGAWLVCTEGKLMQKLKVESQTTKYIDGKLTATEKDRTGGNFNCLKMATIGSLIGGAIAAAAIAATVLTGGAFIGVMASVAAVGGASFLGTLAGTAASFIPGICSMLTRPSKWTVVHEHALIEKKRALLENAVRPCLLGGKVSIVKASIQTALDMALLSSDSYEEDSLLKKNSEWQRVDFNDYPEGLKDPRLWKDGEGFRAFLYKNREGQYTVALRGTAEGEDWKDNLIQGVGLESKQYKMASELAAKIKKELPANTLITGHSLGGGLATIVGAQTGMTTYTYNAAGVHSRTLKKYNLTVKDTEHIYAFSSDDDPLTLAQDNRGLVLGGIVKPILGAVGGLLGLPLGGVSGLLSLDGALPQAAGQRIGLKTDAPKFSGEAHGLQPIIDVLEEELKEASTVKVIAKTK